MDMYEQIGKVEWSNPMTHFKDMRVLLQTLRNPGTYLLSTSEHIQQILPYENTILIEIHIDLIGRLF
jgi:hypothetical protein